MKIHLSDRSLTRFLEATPALPKMTVLFGLSILLFFILRPFEVVIATPFIVLLSRLIVRKRFLTFLLLTWSMGTCVWLLFGIPWIYSSLPLTPHKTIEAISDRWMYVTALPARFLATVCVGLIFINTTSPLQLVNWRVIGPYAVLLLRVAQYGQLEFETTITAMMIQHRWPEPIRWKQVPWPRIPRLFLEGLAMRFKNAPSLVSTNFRNAILWFLPWGWIMFQGILNKPKRRVQ